MTISKSTIHSVENFVKEEMEGLCVAHDFLHIEKVVFNAQKIQSMEGKGNREIVTIAALLHESLDEKFFKKDGMNTRKGNIRRFLESLEISNQNIDEIMFIIENVGFGKSLNRSHDFQYTKEFQIVEDADRLEAIGAIAIGRMFSYGGKKQRPIYDPSVEAVVITDKENYYKNADKSTSFNHFYEKLLLLKDMIHTESGKKIAEPRHRFMELYMEVFLAEWRGER